MIPKGQREFIFDFVVDQRVEVTATGLNGSKGHISHIRVDRK